MCCHNALNEIIPHYCKEDDIEAEETIDISLDAEIALFHDFVTEFIDKIVDSHVTKIWFYEKATELWEQLFCALQDNTMIDVREILDLLRKQLVDLLFTALESVGKEFYSKQYSS